MAGKSGGHFAATAFAIALAACAAGSLAAPAAPLQPLPNLISQDDYPAAARRYELQGRTAVVLTVGVNGRATHCRVATSSGHAVLDATTCRILRARARFTAARDRKGEAVASEYPAVVKWTLPRAAAPVS